MATKVDKKNAIRQGITEAEIVYFQNLAGKTFLYVCGDEYFEASFPIDPFLHLTGVETRLSAKDFYKNAKKSILTNNQFYFDATFNDALTSRTFLFLLLLYSIIKKSTQISKLYYSDPIFQRCK